jgi:hypothetical protein
LPTLERPPASDQLDYQNNEGDDEQKMNQSAANVADKAQKPEHDQYYNYSPEHKVPFF